MELSTMNETQSPNRREFGQAVALFTALPLTASAQAAAEPTEPLFEMVRTRYGKFLSPEQLAKVRASIGRNQALAEQLKAVKLPSSAEPALAFRADLP